MSRFENYIFSKVKAKAKDFETPWS